MFETARSRARPRGATVRLRIALVSAALFAVVGGALLVLTHLLLAESLPTPTKQGIGLVLARGPAAGQAVRVNGTISGGGGNHVVHQLPGFSSHSHSVTQASGGIVTHATGPVPGGLVTPPIQLHVNSPNAPNAKHHSNDVVHALEQAQNVFYNYSVEQRDGTLDHLWLYGGMALALTTLLAFGFSWILARRALRPLHVMSSTARRISHDNLSERIRLGGRPDELTELADTFDELFDRLQASFAAQAHFAANASHELRTPLAIERTVADVALEDPDPRVEDLQEALRKIRAVGVRSEHLIDSLLLLAKSSAPVEHPATVDLRELVTNQLAKLQPSAAVHRLRITVQSREVPVSGDRLLLEQAVSNLLENAVRHNVDGGEIRVTVTRNEGVGLLRVENSGNVLDDEVVSHLVEPFRRAAPARTAVSEGAGLGLSIVTAIAAAHGGELMLHAREGGGLCAELQLPGSSAPDLHAIRGTQPTQ